MPNSGTASAPEQSKGTTTPPAIMSSREKAVICAKEVSRFMGLDLVLLDVSRFSSFADFFIICTGKSSRQVQGIADNVEDGLRGRGLKPLGVEGKHEGHWVLMDYGDVIIHIFYEPIRHFYDLESLWADASQVRWEEEPNEGLSE